MAPPRRGRSASAGGGDGVGSSDDGVVGRIDALAAENSALAAKCDALAAENSALAAKCDALAADVRAVKEVGASPSAGRKRARVEDPPSLEEELATTTTRLLELQNAVRRLEEREAAREPLLERLAADAREPLLERLAAGARDVFVVLERLAADARVPLLERLAADARDVFVGNVLPRLDDGDLAVLAMVNGKMGDIVFESLVDHGEMDVAAVRRRLARVPNFVGSVARLAWAKERGCPWSEWTFACIARGGNVEVAKWAKERGCPWDERICSEAAEGGHMEMLQWARANGCPWDENTCVYAAGEGHLEVLQWARANGAPWDEKTCA
jgi:outer membrane murein-binding lipoprotein Lpp